MISDHSYYSKATQRRRAKCARAAVLLGGVPEGVVVHAERGGDVDWRILAGELDGLSVATGGQHAVHAFWRTPHHELAGRTPLEALDGPASARLLADLVRNRAAAISWARVGRTS